MKPKDEPESGYLTRRLIIRKTRMVITIIRNERTAPPPRLESLETAIRQEAVIWPLSAAVAVLVRPGADSFLAGDLVLMPEAPMHENDLAEALEWQIRIARQSSVMKAITVTEHMR
ncbi:MAG: hypothetical protein ACREDH_03415, partial [Methylocella sp.]